MINHENINSLLIQAVKINNIKLVRLSLAAGADVAADNNCALRWAANNGHLEVVKLLEQHIQESGV